MVRTAATTLCPRRQRSLAGKNKLPGETFGHPRSAENYAENLRISCGLSGQCMSRRGGECGSRKRGNLGHRSGGMCVTKPRPDVLVQERQDKQEKKSRTVEHPPLGSGARTSSPASAPAVPKSPPPRSWVGAHLPTLARPATTANRIARRPIHHRASPRPAGYGEKARTPAIASRAPTGPLPNRTSIPTSRRCS